MLEFFKKVKKVFVVINLVFSITSFCAMGYVGYKVYSFIQNPNSASLPSSLESIKNVIPNDIMKSMPEDVQNMINQNTSTGTNSSKSEGSMTNGTISSGTSNSIGEDSGMAQRRKDLQERMAKFKQENSN